MEFIYVDENKINPVLKCAVCKYPFTNPVFIPALNIRLCRLCIPQASTLINTKLDEFSSLDGNLVHINDQVLLQLLDELPVQCIACERTNIYRKDFPEHRLHECLKRIVLCKASDLQCSWSGPYEEYDKHVQNCAFELLRPVLTDNLTCRKQMEKYDEILTKQQNEIEQLKIQNIQSTAEDTQSEQLQDRLDKYDELFANQKTEIEQLKNHLEKYDELFTNQQNQIQQIQARLEQCELSLNRLQNSFGVVLRQNQAQRRARGKEDQESVSLQNPQIDDIQQLKDQYKQLKDQLEQLAQVPTPTDNTEGVDQLNQRLNQLEQSIPAPADNTEVIDQLNQRLNQLEQSIPAPADNTEVIDQLNQRLNQLEQSIPAPTDNTEVIDQLNQRLNQLEQSIPAPTDNTEAVDQFKQRLDQFDIDFKQMQNQYTETINQFKQIQKQDSYRNNELSYLRQCRDKQEIQICLLARKKSVVPRSYATIDPRIDDLIETYPKYADINLSNKHFDNQDLEAICKRTMFDKQCRKFRLENNEINSKGATIIADSLYGNLTLNELYLANNAISDMGAHAFSQVLSINNYSLTWLELHSNSITDEGAEYLSEMLKTNKTLILLGLNSNKITNRGAQILAGAVTYYNETLQWLLLGSNKGITDESIDNFNDMLVNNTTLQALWLKDCGLSKDGIRRLKESVTATKKNFVFEV